MKYFIDISKQDWLVVFLFAIVFGGVLGSFITVLIGIESLYQGLVTGVIFGLSIFFFSFVLINLSNKYVLKHFDEKFWEFISLSFSFLAGFLGSVVGFFVVKGFNIVEINFPKNILILSFILIGILTALLGIYFTGL